MAAKTLFLQLPPEMGGARFGPFPGRCVLGSDPKRAQIVLDPSLGVFPVHATVTRTGPTQFTVVPANRECKLFLTPNNQSHTWPIGTPVQANAGDLLIIGTPAGPRFQLQSDQPITSAPAAGPNAAQALQTARATGGEAGLIAGVSQFMDGMLRPAGSGIRGEINRQIVARSLARAGPLRSAYVVWTKVRSGAMFSPYVIVGIGIALVGMIGTGSMSCSGILYIVMDVLDLRR